MKKTKHDASKCLYLLLNLTYFSHKDLDVGLSVEFIMEYICSRISWVKVKYMGYFHILISFKYKGW